MSTDHPPPNPTGYTLARVVGQGSNGQVYNYFPNAALDAARPALQRGHQIEAVSKAVLSKVVALKIPQRSSLRKEVQILRTIRTYSSLHPGGKHCAQLLGYEDNTPRISWFIMATTPLCCNLEDFMAELVDPLPRPLLWLLVTQLYDALCFLHRVCRPAVMHGDVRSPNILISHSSDDSTGPPKITLIDFGSAIFADEAEGLELEEIYEGHDVGQLCQELAILCLESCDGVGQMPSGVGAGKIQRFLTRFTAIENLEMLWDEFAEYAVEQLAVVGHEEWEEVKVLTLQAAQKVDEERGSLRRIVRSLLEGTD